MTGIECIAAERARQIEEEGWTTEHDDSHAPGEMACAAGCYAFNAFHDSHFRDDGMPVGWPWDALWWKPKGARADLVRAGALIAAEIDRLDRMAAKEGDPKEAGNACADADRVAALEAQVAALREAVEEIGRQKKTTELDTEYDIEVADFEGGYDMCIERARAAIRAAAGEGEANG